MKRYLMVFASDAISRYNTVFPSGVLVKSLQDIVRHGLPMFVSHDYTRPFAWSKPSIAYFEPGRTRIVGTILEPETDSERSDIRDGSEYYLTEKYVVQNNDALTELRQKISSDLQGGEEPIGVDCACLSGSNLAVRMFPDLLGATDKDGLVDLTELTPIGPGVYQIGDLVVFAHRYFRRSLFSYNPLNSGFLRELQAICSDNASPRIALDPDLVGLASSYEDNYMEFEYWWGPKFDDDLTSIPLGVTVHKSDERQRYYHGVSELDIWWHEQDGRRTLEAEELRDLPAIGSNGDPLYGCRYVHTMLNPDGEIFHFDGAIRAYTEEEMLVRLDNNIMHAGRNTQYTKIWRLDGKIAIELWKKLLSEYFRDNPLMGEYLGGKEPVTEEALSTISRSPSSGERENALIRRYVPFSIDKGRGPRIALSYLPVPDIPSGTQRIVMPIDSYQVDEQHTPYVSTDAIEIVKVLRRAGHTIELPRNIGFIDYVDRYIDLPIIFHSGRDAVDATLSEMARLVQHWNGDDADRVLSFKVGFPLGDLGTVVSVFGHVGDVSDWLAASTKLIPESLEEVPEWASSVSNQLSQYPPADNKPDMFDLLHPYGVIAIRRRRIEYETRPYFSEELHAFMYEVGIPETEAHLIEALRNGSLNPGFGAVIDWLECSRCGKSYVECDCSKSLDDDVHVIVHDIDRMPVWSDRPA